MIEEIGLLKTQTKVNIRCKIHPQAKENKIQAKMQDGTYKISLTAVPENGKANDALIDFLSKVTKVPKKNIQILNWHTSRIKTLQFIW